LNRLGANGDRILAPFFYAVDGVAASAAAASFEGKQAEPRKFGLIFRRFFC